MTNKRTHDEAQLRAALTDAESAARTASNALLDTLSPEDERVREAVETRSDYCRCCPDAFQALDIARLLRALVDDMDSSIYSQGPVEEWAHAEVRLQSLASRIARALRDQGAFALEQMVVDLSVLHLHALEDGPRYHEILGEMSRVLNSSVVRRPVTLVEEFSGLARRHARLPTDAPE